MDLAGQDWAGDLIGLKIWMDCQFCLVGEDIWLG